MKKSLLLLPFALMFALVFTACEKDDDDDKGSLNLFITDAPIDSDGIESVWITIQDLHYQTDQDGWVELGLEEEKKIDLLQLTRGDYEELGNFELEAGTYNQIRFMLDAPAFNEGPQENPGCYLEFEDKEPENLFIPSGYETGFKGIGTFTVPINGQVEVTADWDVRRSVVEAGVTGMYILKPTIRLVVNNQAGDIQGNVDNIPEGKDIVIYAYEQGEYDDTEAQDPGAEDTRFPNAITSDKVDENNFYHLAFLAGGAYDLIVTATGEGEFVEVLGVVEDVLVESTETTNEPIVIDELDEL